LSNLTDAIAEIETDLLAWIVNLSGLKQALVATLLKDLAAFAVILEQEGVQLIEDEVSTIRNWALGAVQATAAEALADPKIAMLPGGERLQRAAELVHDDIQSDVLLPGNNEAKKLTLSHMMTVTQLAYNTHKAQQKP